MQIAAGLAALPTTAALAAAGRLTSGQARAAATTARRIPVEHRAAFDEAVAAAVDGWADSNELRNAIADWTHRLDQRLLASRAERSHEQRRLTITRHGEAGVLGEFRLDPLGAETLLTALGSLSAPRGQSDARTPEQRRADALVTLARQALDRGATPTVGGERPHVTVVVQARTLTAAGATGTAASPGTPPAMLDYGGPVGAETARLLACDAAITRVVMSGPSIVLDAGRATRLVTPGQRRALVARDGGCRGCGAPEAWCQAHHIIHWADGGGATDLANLVLLCFACHDGVHHRGWKLTPGPDGLWHLRAPPRARRGRVPGQVGPYRTRRPTTRALGAPGKTRTVPVAQEGGTVAHRGVGPTSPHNPPAAVDRHRPSTAAELRPSDP